ncbi:hypothetical protein PRUB_a0581 [Pseudoalteromonas rubra]|uniref:Uncharacterized protein n=1 Tax=Pseudoalteromonas rubra TaxID=43658 RepID=A0A8T0C5R3_9GAMM|nr:hypothetical protein PRUB_a0581 [Pseudoalteromonas rubra]
MVRILGYLSFGSTAACDWLMQSETIDHERLNNADYRS